jgi:Zn-dependent M28 family amino/carboxypeptidase
MLLNLSSTVGAAPLSEVPSARVGQESTNSRQAPPLAERLHAHVVQLASQIGERHVWRPRALHAAADYIRQEWQIQGYAVRPQRYVAYGVTSENLEIARTGSDRAGEIIIIGAHYDTVRGSPGANDNASGVAALLEIGRTLKDVALRRTVRLVAFVNEEPPFFYSDNMGSGEYARMARQRGDDIRLMVSLEMLGAYSDEPDSQRYPPIIGWFYPDRANFIAFVSNIASRRVLKRTVETFRSVSEFPSEYLATFTFVPGVSWSDQLSFWRQGYPALMVTDTAYNRYPYYHTVLDTPEKLDYTRMAQVVDGLAQAIIKLANEEAPL